MATDPFRDSRLGIEHAKRRFEELKSEILAFNDSNPYAFVVEPNEDGTEEIHKIKLTKPQALELLSGIAFETANHLRAALDRAGYTVAVARQATGKNAKFPFGDTITEVESRRKSQSKDIPKEIFDLMVTLKPYKGGNVPLWALNKIANANKHEILVPFAVTTGRTFLEDVGTGEGGRFRWPPVWDAAKNEMAYAWYPTGKAPDNKLGVVMHLTVSYPQEARGPKVVDVFHTMISETERSLMAIEDEARRIGLIT